MQDMFLSLWCKGVARLHEIRSEERGATAVEYGVMVALIVAVIIATVSVIGDKTSNGFETVNSNLP